MCLPHVPMSFFLMYFMYNCSKIVLPCRSRHWDDISHPLFYNGLSPPRSSFVHPKAVILKAPWKFTKVKCPVTDANRDAWTEEERVKAGNRVVARNLEDAQRLVSLLLLTSS